MVNLFKNTTWLLRFEIIITSLIILSPLIGLSFFLFNHNTLVLSTKTWLLLSSFYIDLLIITLPLIYSLTVEVLGKLNQNKINSQLKTESVSLNNQI